VADRPRSLGHNRNFLLLWSGQFISGIGTGVSQLAFPLLTLALSGSPAQTGFVVFLGQVPYFLLSLPVGALVDRWDRRRVMLMSQVGRALSLLSIPLVLALGHPSVLQLDVIAFVDGIFFVFFDPAEASSLPRLVSSEQLPSAISLYMTTESMSGLLGAPLGGLLYSAGRAFPFVADALSYLVSACSLLFIKASFQQERAKVPPSPLRETRQGLKWLWHQPVVASLTVITGGLNLIFPAWTLIVIVVAQRQHVSPALIGAIFALGEGSYTLGTLLGALLQRWLRLESIILGACWLFVLLWPLFAVVSNLLMFAAILLGLSLLRSMYGSVEVSYRLARVPDDLRGRVTSINHLFTFGSEPVGLALTGVLIERIGVVRTILLLGIGLLILALAMTLNPHIRKLRLSSQQLAD
jgi:predicted MFS family arabinose efflux permease